MDVTLWPAPLPIASGLELRTLRAVRGALQLSAGSTLVDTHFHVGADVAVEPFVRQLFVEERLPLALFDDFLETFCALLEGDADRPRDLASTMREPATLAAGLSAWRAQLQHLRGPSEAERFSSAHFFLSRVIHEGAHLSEMERSFLAAREDLERTRQVQLRILEDSQRHVCACLLFFAHLHGSLELARVASSNAAPEPELLEGHREQLHILRSKFERLARELDDAQRAEYQQFVTQFAIIERQTPQSRRLLAGTPTPHTESAAVPAAVAISSPVEARKPFVARVAARTSSSSGAVAAKLAAVSVPRTASSDSLSASAPGVVVAANPSEAASASDWLEAEYLRTTLTVMVRQQPVRVSLVTLANGQVFSNRRMDAPGLLRAAIVCEPIVVPSTVPELHFSGEARPDSRYPELLSVVSHSNLPSCDVELRLHVSTLEQPSLSKRRAQMRDHGAALRRALSLCLSAGISTVSVPLLLVARGDVMPLWVEDEGAAWAEHVQAVVACVREAVVWPGKDDDALRHVRFYLPADLPDSAYERAVSLVREPFVWKTH